MTIGYQHFGEKAILLSWPERICQKTSLEVYQINQSIQPLIPEFIRETVTAYCSITIYTQTKTNKTRLINKLQTIYNSLENTSIESTLWKVPVCYDTSLAIDLPYLAKLKGFSIEKVIELHSKPTYQVDFLGFLPGFPYLSGLNPLLHTPRLPTPRPQVAKGSIAIGGGQTGVYPIKSPAGWHIIARTPMQFFDVNNPNPCFIKPMDQIKFIPITLKEFNHD